MLSKSTGLLSFLSLIFLRKLIKSQFENFLSVANDILSDCGMWEAVKFPFDSLGTAIIQHAWGGSINTIL